MDFEFLRAPFESPSLPSLQSHPATPLSQQGGSSLNMNPLKQAGIDLSETLRLLEKNSPNLTILDLRYKNLCAEQILSLCEVTKKNTNLKTLYIAGNIIKDFEPIKNMMIENSSLERMDLSFCNLDAQSAQMLRDAIEARPVAFDQLKVLGNFSKKEEKSIFDLVKASQVSKPLASGSGKPPRARSNALSEGPRADAASPRVAATPPYPLHRNRSFQLLNEGRAFGAPERPTMLKKMGENRRRASDVSECFRRINLADIQVAEQISGTTESMVANCIVDGWNCVVKIVRLNREGTDSDMVQSALVELRIYSSLPPHPNIARYLFHRKTETSLKLFLTKYSTSLRSLILKKKSALPARSSLEEDVVDPPNAPTVYYFSPSDIAFWLLSICRGVEYLHSYKVVHCDLKPDNVLCLLNNDYSVQNVVIADFNSAKLDFEDCYSSKPVGTAAYMSPEVFCSNNHHLFSYEADIWSIGMTLYEMITLKEPYEDEDAFQVPDLVKQGIKPKLPKFTESAEYRGLIEIYHKCVEIDPKDRLSIRMLIKMTSALIY